MTRNFQPLSDRRTPSENRRTPDKKKKKSSSSKKSHRHEHSSPLSCCTRGVIFLTLECIVLVTAIFASIMAQFNNSNSLFDAANDVEALGSYHLYTAWDLSCYGTWGYRENCFTLKSSWDELHCQKRKDMVIAGAMFLYLSAVCVVIVIVFMVLGKLKVAKLPRLALLMIGSALVGFLISWTVFLGLFLSDTCKSEQAPYEKYPLKNYTKVGPGFFLIIFAFIMQAVVLLFYFQWKEKLWFS